MRTPVYDPGDPPEQATICEVCGRECDTCICPECPTCGVVGEPECYQSHGLLMSAEQFQSRNYALRAQAAECESDAYAEQWLNSVHEWADIENLPDLS